MIFIEMQKAREIKKNQLRAERKPILEKLDVDYIKAQESGDQELIKSIVNKKQSLRDALSNPDIDNAKTPEELKQIKLQ